MTEFKVAAKRQAIEEAGPDGEEEELFYFFFTIDGKPEEFWARRPTPNQMNILFSSAGGEALRAPWRFLQKVLIDDGYQRLRRLIADEIIPAGMLLGGDELNSNGIIDTIISEFSGRPTESSADSSPSPTPAGGRSTGRVPSKAGSTPRASRSTGS